MSIDTKNLDEMDKKARKAALKEEAGKLGISYDEMKKRYKAASSSGSKRKKHTEADKLESDEHKKEIKRMRSYSKDFDDTSSGGTATNGNTNRDNNERKSKRPRTRSFDKSEESKAIIQADKNLTTDEWRKEHTLTLKGHGKNSGEKSFASPYIEFTDSPFSAKILKTLTNAGFDRPMPIQAQAWSLAAEGKDLISIAKTGSGKTCGFLLPVFHDHQTQQSSRSNSGGRPGFVKPMLLVLAPTRELCVQIAEESKKFGQPLGIRTVCIYGGSSKYPQIQAMQRGVECIIATPGRLNDLIEQRKADLSGIKYLVLDEADRMLDMVRVVFFCINACLCCCCHSAAELWLLHVPLIFNTHSLIYFVIAIFLNQGLRTTNPFNCRQNSKATTNDAVFGHLAKSDSTVGL